MTSGYKKTYNAGVGEAKRTKLTGTIHYAVLTFTSCFVAYSIYSAYMKALQTPAFRIEHIQISGLSGALEQDVRASLKPFFNQPLYAVSTSAILEKLLSHALVQKAVVMKRQPNILRVEASVQVPYAIWQSSKPIVVDSSGASFRDKNQAFAQSRTDKLPRIVTKNKKLFLQALELFKRNDIWPDSLGTVTTIQCDPVLGSQVYFEKGLKVFLMPASLEAQWLKLVAFIHALPVPVKDIAEIHFEGDATLRTASIKWRTAKSHNLEAGTSS
jgi:cell division septal protein FtsQ